MTASHASHWRLALAGVVVVLLPMARGDAQASTGRLEGTVVDSAQSRPPEGGSVLAVRIDPPAHSAGGFTDPRGRYRIDSLPAGRYMVEFASPFLDSLEIALPPREVAVEPGHTVRADFAIPSGGTLRAGACPGVALGPGAGAGAVIGRVVDADTDLPLAGARVAVAWHETTLDRATMRPQAVERSGAVDTDSLDRYRLCGVPTDDWVLLQVQHDGRAGSQLRQLVPDGAGVALRHLSLSVTASRPLAADDAPASADSAAPLTGTAALAGVVRGVGGLPLGDAQVRVIGARGVVLSDARGRFALGDLPSGTQVLEVRRIGYLLAQQPVELRAGRTVAQDVQLRRIVTLDSMRVLARRSQYRDFEDHRKRNRFGTFLTADDIERRHPFYTSDLFRQIPGYRVYGFGIDAKVGSGRGVISLTGPCETNIVIDGMQHQDVNLIHPGNIGAMEVYRAGEPRADRVLQSLRHHRHLVEAVMSEHPANVCSPIRARMRARAGRLLPVTASLLLAIPLGAQTEAVGRIEGTIKETTPPRGVKGASVTLARLDPQPPLAFGAKPDEQGRYHLDSLPAGRYMIQLTHATLDSLGLALPASEVLIADGQTAEVRFSLPSSLALRDAVCRGLALKRETGAVVGHVLDADTDRPLAHADVAISWTDLSFDRKTLHATAEQHDNWVRTGPRGEYRICNVPLGSWLLIQLQYAGRAGNAVRVSVSGEEAVVVRDLSLSVTDAPTLEALDSAGATVRGLDREPALDDSLDPGLYLTGSASVSGIVRGDGGRPLDDVEIRVVNARPSTRTDAAGRFTLHNLPAGTQLLAVRRIGYLVGDVAVELRADRTVRQDVLLRRVVSLDSMRVVGRRSRYADFEWRRKNNPMGRFLTANDLARQKTTELAPVIQRVGGFSILGFGPDAQVFSTSARASRPNCAEVNVVIDGVDQASINMVAPHDIAAVEIYPEAAGAPGQYRAECGLILIWTKRWKVTPPT